MSDQSDIVDDGATRVPVSPAGRDSPCLFPG